MSAPQSQATPSPDPEPLAAGGKARRFWRWFWLTFLVVSLAYAWYSFYVPPNRIAWADNYTAAHQQATESGKPMILFFTGEWCVPCRIMKREVWADEQVLAAVNVAFIPVTIDVDDPEEAATMSRYGVGNTPTTIITDSGGGVLQQRGGGMNKAEFLEMLGKVNPPASEGM